MILVRSIHIANIYTPDSDNFQPVREKNHNYESHREDGGDKHSFGRSGNGASEPSSNHSNGDRKISESHQSLKNKYKRDWAVSHLI